MERRPSCAGSARLGFGEENRGRGKVREGEEGDEQMGPTCHSGSWGCRVGVIAGVGGRNY
jgi:hypothetical protein